MEIKTNSQDKSYLDVFDIADSSGKETNLSKILAYVISKDERALKAFLKLLDDASILGRNYAKTLLKKTSVSIEVSYNNKQLQTEKKGGRTDIEIKVDAPQAKIFIIVECKVGKNKATIQQYNLYKPIYKIPEKSISEHKKYFVYLSHQSGINIVNDNRDVAVIDITWRDVINALSNVSDSSEKSELQSFINYYERRYGMANQKEILVQDLSDPIEVERLNNFVYRRGKVNGSPLYFAPYFTRSYNGGADKKEGITQFSKILGIVTTSNISWGEIESNCNRFIKLSYPDLTTDDKEVFLKKWNEAIKHDEKFLTDSKAQKREVEKLLNAKKEKLQEKTKNKCSKSETNLVSEIENLESLDSTEKIKDFWHSKSYTYYFLDIPTQLTFPLKKDGGNKEGRGKNWIAAAIPQNRCVSFSDFINHSILSPDYNKKEKISLDVKKLP